MRHALLTAALLALALAIASCGGDDDSVKAESASLGKDSNGAEIDPDEIATASDGRLWVTIGNSFASIDPDAEKLATQPQRITGSQLAYDIAAGDAGVWAVASRSDQSVALIPADPRTGRSGRPVPVELETTFLGSGESLEVAVGAGRVWAAPEGQGLLVILNPETGEQRGVAPQAVEDIAAGGGYGWVVSTAEESPV